MKRLLPVIFCLIAFPLFSSHIVGGEFEIIHLSDYLYRVNLIIYFDEVNGLQGNKTQDQIIGARIFRVRDNAVMREVTLPFTQITNVNYSQSECAIGQLQTSRMYYTTVIELPPDQYNDPQGYYIVWERCCRNYNIKNIFSDNPQLANAVTAAGQTFYLRFPPVSVDGKQFINSSPRLFPPLSDYACINQPYYADFAGTDDDGDSLAYSIVTPLSTHTQEPYPPILAAPYPLVQWRAAYGVTNVLNGSPDLAITSDGLLTVTPTDDTGLFVFAVKCDEYRNGVKIGEVRRDFQMLVQDCREAVPPSVSAKLPDGNYVQSSVNVTYPNTVADDQRCITVRVTDSDAFRLADGQSETVSIRAIPLGFKTEDTGVILPEEITSVLTPDNPFHEFQVCFDKCPAKDGPYKIGVITYDDACALPLADTVIVTVNIEAPDNVPVTLSADITENIQEGVSRTWTILATDGDNDPLIVDIIPVDFELADAGLSFFDISHTDGRYEAKLKWDALCDVYDFSQKQDFMIKIAVDDIDDCLTNPTDTIFVNLHVILPYSNPPVIGTDLPAIEIQNGVERNIFEALNFEVFGTDSDPETLTLEMITEFPADNYGVSFPTATGKFSVSSDFNWQLLCEKINVAEKEDFQFLFVVRDAVDKCNIYRADSLTINVHVNPSVNFKPEISIDDLSNLPVVNGQAQMTVGQTLTLNVKGVDPDNSPQDPVTVELIEVPGESLPSGYTFTKGEGLGSATAVLSWTPDCSVIKPRYDSTTYRFTFRTTDLRCADIKGDTTEYEVRVGDFEIDPKDFIPPNFITPNGDGCNDFFGLEEVESASCGEVHLPKLPKDNCRGQFKSISIYNRWGKEVFLSDQRNFRWFANGEAAGVYFYTLFYSHTEYKGTITVMY